MKSNMVPILSNNIMARLIVYVCWKYWSTLDMWCLFEAIVRNATFGVLSLLRLESWYIYRDCKH
jgi:hypothetical protein